MNTHLTTKSKNGKTGPIPVSTSPSLTCPDACPLKSAGCYAKSGPLGIHWRAVDGGRGMPWPGFLAAIQALPERQLWRHNQAGDLPGVGNEIDRDALAELVEANKGRRGFTYTHKPLVGKNLAALRQANRAGFTVNLSGNSMAHADTLVKTGLPVVCIVPAGTPARFVTPAGNKGNVCPAQLRDDVTCARCGLCAVAGRGVIVGFLPHGSGAKHAEAIANA